MNSRRKPDEQKKKKKKEKKRKRNGTKAREHNEIIPTRYFAKSNINLPMQHRAWISLRTVPNALNLSRVQTIYPIVSLAPFTVMIIIPIQDRAVAAQRVCG